MPKSLIPTSPEGKGERANR